MKLHTLETTTTKPKKRLGLGYGSGKGGHTSGRGQKGQKARGDMPLTFVGSSWVWFKRLPFMRGKSVFKKLHLKRTLSLSDLNCFQNGEVVNQETLRSHNLIPKGAGSMVCKIVNSGKLDKSLIVHIPATPKAKQAIIQAGGEYQSETA